MTSDLYAGAAGQQADSSQRWALASANWSHLLNEFKTRKLRGEHIQNAKDKEKLIRLVTLPQLLCIAFPLRRRELTTLRAHWIAARELAREKGHDPALHPAVLRAEQSYFRAAVPHMMLAITIDDGMRKQQYQRGRLGEGSNFHPLFMRRGGRPTSAIEGLRGMQTNWSGDRADPAHLKIRQRDDRLDTRPGRDVRPGTVDMTMLWDLISVWRPKQLVSAGLVPSVDAYDLEADMKVGRWALFPSHQRTPRDDNSRTNVSAHVGRELHYLVRRFLRPDVDGHAQVPAWEDLDDSWRGLWAQHVTRLLLASYVGGVRNDWSQAMYLTKDTEETLRHEYSVVNVAMEDKLGLDVTNWEHPNAYDRWMDRILKGREVFDPLEDPELPMPAHIRSQLDMERATARLRRRPAGGQVRLRQARPGQSSPARAPNAAM
jgi:hypothetical protein